MISTTISNGGYGYVNSKTTSNFKTMGGNANADFLWTAIGY